jgi:hypothetical protein
MQASKGWVLVIGVLLILTAGVVATVVIVRNTANSAIQPIQQGNSSLQTQVASFLHPTPTVIPDPATIIHEVRSLARLETIQFSVEKVITAETAQGRFAFLFGDKLLFVAHGTVIAGVDLAKMNAGDVSIVNGVLNMRLPAAEIFVATLDNANSYVYDRQTGVLTHGDMNLETTARRAAEDEIRKAALQDGILAEAQTNAQDYLSRLFRDMGFQDVIFTQATPEPPD